MRYMSSLPTRINRGDHGGHRSGGLQEIKNRIFPRLPWFQGSFRSLIDGNVRSNSVSIRVTVLDIIDTGNDSG